MQTQPSAQGIASLYMGNPGALQQRIQKDQQAKPGLPPDLKNLMALNIVTNEQDAAKRQQAMSALNSMAPAGQEPPTVAQSLQEQAKQKMQAQMLQQQRQQQGLMELAKQQRMGAVPAGTPQPEAQPQPQGIDELPVEMGLAGGGIVAFAEGEDVPYETRYDRMNRENREREAREREERIAQIRASGNEAGATTYGEQMRGLGQFIDRMVPDPVRLFRRLVSDPSLAREEAAAAPPQASYSNEGRRTAQPPAPPAAPAAPGAGAAPRQAPAGGIAQAAPSAARPAPAAPSAPAPEGLSALLEKGIREDIGRDRESEARKMVEAQRGIMGMDQYQKSMADALAGRQAAFDKAKSERTPAWATGLAALGGAPIRGGLGMMLAQAGTAAEKQRGAYGAEDLKMQEVLDTLRTNAAKAALEGNTDLAKTYANTYKEVDAARRAALQSGTSLENTRESARSREQVAADNRAARAQGAQNAAEQRNMNNATQAIARDEVINALQEELKNALKLPTQANQARIAVLRKQIEDRQTAIYKRFGVPMVEDKMTAAPGAASPGGTTRLRFDAQGNPIK